MKNKHDLARKEALIQALSKAKDQADNALLYLTVNDRTVEDVDAAAEARWHIEQALERLGAKVPVLV